jgi:hypothetical protein
VQTGGPNSGDGREPTEAESNVVRFPRDWIGPREDLVPIGRADPQAQPADPAADRPARTASAFTTPPSADDFWSEDSAAVQDALQAPHAGVLDTGAAEVPPVEQVRGHHRDRAAQSQWAPRFPRRVSWSVPRVPRPRTKSTRRRTVRMALALIVAAAGVGLLLGQLLIDQSGRGVPTLATAKPPGHPLEFGRSLRRWIGGAIPHASREIAARVRVAPGHQTRRPPARQAHRKARRAGAPTTSYVASGGGSTAGSASTAASNGGTTASASPASSTGGSSAETVQSSAVTNDSGGSGGGGSSGSGGTGGGGSGGSSGGNGQPSGPVGPGAPFGPGKLG